MWSDILEKLQMLDYWSMGIGMVLIVAAFFVWTQIKKNRKNKNKPVIK